MSFRRFPFQFSNVDQFDRANSRLEESRNMFHETSSSRRNQWNDCQQNESHSQEPAWRTHPPPFRHSSDSIANSARNINRTPFSSNWPEDGVPIKVIREKRQTKEKSSDTSSECDGSNSATQSPHEPRIHHIPIMVEPRDGSSSGYVSDSGSEKSTSAVKQNQAHDHDINEKRSKKNYPENKAHVPSEKAVTHDATKATKNFESFRKPHVHHIPITVEPRAGEISPPVKLNVTKPSPLHAFPSSNNKDDQPLEGPVFSSRKTDSTSNVTEQHKPSTKKTVNKPGNGPHVTKIPINVSNDQSSYTSSNPMNQVDIALSQIARIDSEVAELKKQVDAFSGGTNQDKQYRYLDEMLTRCMLKLDDVDTCGLDTIRKSRKLVINKVQECISLLESKLSNSVEKAEGITIDNSTKYSACDVESIPLNTDSVKISFEEAENNPDVANDTVNKGIGDNNTSIANKGAGDGFTATGNEGTWEDTMATPNNGAGDDTTVNKGTEADTVTCTQDRTNEIEKIEIDHPADNESTTMNENNCQTSIPEAMEIDETGAHSEIY